MRENTKERHVVPLKQTVVTEKGAVHGFKGKETQKDRRRENKEQMIKDEADKKITERLFSRDIDKEESDRNLWNLEIKLS